jgi:site-specific recombinase XerD
MTTKHQPFSPALDDALRRFLRMLAANKSQATITAYRTDLTQFLTFLQETNITVAQPSDIHRDDLAEYLATLAEQGRSGITRARKLAALRVFFRFLEADGLVAVNPAKGLETPKKERSGRNTLRPDEYTKLLSLAGANPRDYAILQVFLQTGIRVSELCSVKLEDIDFTNRTLRVLGKGQQTRTIELEKKGIQAIRSYLVVRPNALHQELFLNYQGEPLSDRGVRKMLDKYLKAAGITKAISPHSLRHTFATHKAERGVSPYQLKEWLGHARLDTTAIYVHMARSNAKKAMEATSL